MSRHPVALSDASAAPAPVVDCPAGRIVGDLDPVFGCDRFRGIPYAKPPVGSRRFAAAERHPGWPGTLDARQFGAAAAQVFDPHEASFEDFGESGAPRAWVGHEDCLTLNIWRPAARGARRPVIVWIHGGANWLESSRLPIYDGARFAASGAVFVSLNYRLGVFGFLDLTAIGGPAEAHSNGLTDQLAALAWVQDNIASFGGDPDNVTLMGESAGSMDISWLLASGQLPSGVRRLVLMSGVASVVGLGWDGVRSAHAATEGIRRAEAFLGELGFGDFESLRRARCVDILTRQADVARRSSILLDLDTLFYPRTGPLAARDPFAAAHAGAGRGLDVMIGFTNYEMGLWLLWDNELDQRSPEWAASAAPHLPARARQALPAQYRAWFPDETDGARGMHLLGDAMFAMPSLWLADLLRAAGARVHAYRFDWQADARRRALHAADQAFFFSRQATPAGEALIGRATATDGAARQRLADLMHSALVEFARVGSPSTADLDWPAWQGEQRPTLLFDTTPRVVDDPLRERRLWWTANVLPRTLGGGA